MASSLEPMYSKPRSVNSMIETLPSVFTHAVYAEIEDVAGMVALPDYSI
jgi:hypothetical protein